MQSMASPSIRTSVPSTRTSRTSGASWSLNHTRRATSSPCTAWAIGSRTRADAYPLVRPAARPRETRRMGPLAVRPPAAMVARERGVAAQGRCGVAQPAAWVHAPCRLLLRLHGPDLDHVGDDHHRRARYGLRPEWWRSHRRSCGARDLRDRCPLVVPWRALHRGARWRPDRGIRARGV